MSVPPAKPRGSLLRAVWRWHFYAGLIAAPVLVATALTGALFVFKDDIVEWPQAAVLSVEPTGEARPADEWAEAVASAYPGSRVKKWLVPADPRRAVVAELAHKKKEDGEPRGVAVDPYTAEVRGEVTRESPFFKVVLAIHRRLYAGWWGRVAVEIATSWAVLLTLTGLCLWWPRGPKAAGVWYPRLWAKPYVVLRDLHSVAGFYLALFLAVVLVTGLSFSVVWGAAFKAATRAGGKNPKEAMALPRPPKGSGAPTLQQAVDAGRFCFPGCLLEVEAGKKKEPAQVAARGHGPKEDGRVLVGKGGELLAVRRASELPALAQVRLWAYPLHTGSVFGWPTKVLATLAALGLALFAVTGVCMWWVRRPKGKAGLPRKPDIDVPWWLAGTILVLGVLLPLAGATMVLALAAEWLLGRPALGKA